MKYLYVTKELTQRIATKQQLNIIKWSIDASFGVHPDFKSHTGGVITFSNTDGGAPITISRKQRLNTKSSTEAELVAVDDVSTLVLWTKLFLEEQGYEVVKNILFTRTTRQLSY